MKKKTMMKIRYHDSVYPRHRATGVRGRYMGRGLGLGFGLGNPSGTVSRVHDVVEHKILHTCHGRIVSTIDERIFFLYNINKFTNTKRTC